MSRQGKSSNEEVSFADVMLEKRYRKTQNVFLNQVDKLIDWRPIRTQINKKYTKQQNAAGAPSYDVFLLFKMLLLQTWYGLSDCALEERVNDSVTFSRFLDLGMESVSPDHSTISRFRTALTGQCTSLWRMIARTHAVIEKRMKRRLITSFFFTNAKGQIAKLDG